MRAKYVGKRKAEEELGESGHQSPQIASDEIHRGSANESLEERTMRQKEERERLLRELEEDDNLGDIGSPKLGEASLGVAKNKDTQKRGYSSAKKASSFPLQFPDRVDYNSLSPIEVLEAFESSVLRSIKEGRS
jgi:hypothetical protein